jgi:hypothetical protein
MERSVCRPLHRATIDIAAVSSPGSGDLRSNEEGRKGRGERAQDKSHDVKYNLIQK